MLKASTIDVNIIEMILSWMWRCLPDKVEECVDGVDLGRRAVTRDVALVWVGAGPHDIRHDDAQNDGAHGGRGEVGDGPQPHLAARAGVQPRDAGNQTRHHQRQNEHLEHAHQHLSRKHEIHDVTLVHLSVRVAHRKPHGAPHDHGPKKENQQHVLLHPLSHFAPVPVAQAHQNSPRTRRVFLWYRDGHVRVHFRRITRLTFHGSSCTSYDFKTRYICVLP